MRLNLDTFELQTFSIGYSVDASTRHIYIDLFTDKQYYRHFISLGQVYRISEIKSGRLIGGAGVTVSDEQHNRILEMIENKTGMCIEDLTKGDLEYRE